MADNLTIFDPTLDHNAPDVFDGVNRMMLDLHVASGLRTKEAYTPTTSVTELSDDVKFFENNFYIPTEVTEFSFSDNSIIHVWTWNVGTTSWDETTFTSVAYTPTAGAISAISDGVTHDGTHFLIPTGVTSFTFTEGTTDMEATFSVDTWSFALETSEVAYTPAPGPITAISDGVTHNGTHFLVPTAVTTFTFTDGTTDMVATLDGTWSFAEALPTFDDLIADANTVARFVAHADNVTIVDGSATNEVQQLNDLSGNGHHLAQDTATRYPVLDGSEIKFNYSDTNDFLINSLFTLDQPCTVYLVMKHPEVGWSSGKSVLQTGMSIAQRTVIPMLRCSAGTTDDDSIEWDKYDVLCITYNGTSSTFKWGELAESTSIDYGTGSFTNLILGNNEYGSSGARFSFKEKIIRNVADTEVNKGIIFDHLRSTYAEVLVDYTPSPGAITSVSDGVTFDTDLSKFIVPITVTSFTFLDNSVSYTATYNSGTESWDIALTT
jgi:hypothetical protein